MTLASSSDTIRILLLDDDALARAGLELLLEHQSDFRVIIQGGTEEDGLRLASEAQPDIVLLHENLSGSIFLDMLPKLVAALRQPRIILITSRADSEYSIQAVNGGAMGVVLARQRPEVLFKAIEKVHAGEVWLDRTLMASVLAQNIQFQNKVDPKTRKKALLSKREREVIVLVGEGQKNQQIADQLFLSEVTVRHHLTSIFKKLGVTDRLELVIYAYQNGLAKLPE
jgi:two-component system nitrate/nitrite response regulator NarL